MLFNKKNDKKVKEIYHDNFGKLIFEFDSKNNRLFTRNSNNLIKGYNSIIKIENFSEDYMSTYIDTLKYIFDNNEEVINNLKNCFTKHYFSDDEVNSGLIIDGIRIINYYDIKNYIDEMDDLGVNMEGINELKDLLNNSSSEHIFSEITARVNNIESYAIAYLNEKENNIIYCFDIF